MDLLNKEKNNKYCNLSTVLDRVILNTLHEWWLKETCRGLDLKKLTKQYTFNGRLDMTLTAYHISPFLNLEYLHVTNLIRALLVCLSK